MLRVKPTNSGANLPLSYSHYKRKQLELGLGEEAYSDAYAEFQDEYRQRPGDFANDCILWDGEHLTSYQREILDAIVEHGREAVRGPHGLGKTSTAAIALLWFALTRDGDDWKVVTTASAWRQLTKFMFPEVHKWARRLRWDKIGRRPFNRDELLTLSLKLETGEAFAVASDNPELIEGAHADHILYIFDESKAIKDATFDASEGAFAGTGEAYALAISTPGEPHGRFYDIHARKPGLEDWHTRHVTLDEAIDAGRIATDWAEQRKAQWGAGSAVYQNRVVGEFAADETTSIIPLSWVEAANERWHEWQASGELGAFFGLGVDVSGGTGGDAITLALCYDRFKILEVRRTAYANDPNTATMEIAGRVGAILGARGGGAFVDVIGIGAGVYHRLRELHYNAKAFNAANGTDYTDQSGELGFANWRAAMWWIAREMLDPSSGVDVALPPDDMLTGDLTAPKLKRITSQSKMIVESKEDTRKRLGRSTDTADAVLQILVGPLLAREADNTFTRVGSAARRIGR